MSAKDNVKIAARALTAELVKIVQEEPRDVFGFSDDDLHLLKGTLRYMNDDELALVANSGYFNSEAVADFLAPRIAPMSLRERVALGVKMNHWCVWAKIVEVPGLSNFEIKDIKANYNTRRVDGGTLTR